MESRQDSTFHAFHWSDIGFTTNTKQEDVVLYSVPKIVSKRLNPKRRKKMREKARLEKLVQYTGYSSSFVSAGQTLDGGYSYSTEDQTAMPSDKIENTNLSSTRHEQVENSLNPDGNQAEVTNPSIVGGETLEESAVASSSGQETKEPISPDVRHAVAMIVRILADNNYRLDVEDLQDKMNMEQVFLGFDDTEAFIEFLKGFRDVFYLNESETSVASVEVGLLVDLEICLPHTSGNCEGKCNELHLCKFYVLNNCEIWNCKFGHDYETPHNQRVLESHFMQYLHPTQVNSLLRALLNRKGVTVPGICRFYNNTVGCRNTETCPYLHVCRYIAETCRFYPFCKFSHNLLDVQPRSLLWKYGINMNYVKKEDVFKVLLRSAFTDTQNVDQKRMVKEITTGIVQTPIGGTATSVAKSAESPSPYQWKPKDSENAPENWHEFTEEESKIIHLKFMKYKKAYERYLKFKDFSTTFGNKKLSVDFSKMEGIIESESTSQAIALKKYSAEEKEDNIQSGGFA